MRWAREEAVPEILRQADAADFLTAFQLAERAEKSIPNDAVLNGIWPRISALGSVETSPAGAAVFMKPYGAPDTDWKFLGTTPLKNLRLPRGAFQWRVEKAGYRTLELASPNPGVMLQNLASLPSMILPLSPESEIPPEMVFVPGGAYPVRLSGFNTRENVPLDPFLIDRHEVTNRSFKEFVDAGGYQNPANWTGLAFLKDGRELSYEEAQTYFVDSTGRRGPSTWELGTYPTDKADHPVSGVSWYEAVAYCRSQGKELPTIYHWARAAMSPGEHLSALAPAMLNTSNFRGNGPEPVGKNGIGPYGTFDTAGNVREWQWNEAASGRWSLGGAWADPAYVFTVRNAPPPLDRAPANGLRCAKYLTNPPSAQFTGRIEVAGDYRSAKSVSNEVFEAYKRLYAYERSDLNAKVESTETQDNVIRETVTLDAGYRNERLTVYLFIPRQSSPPHTPVIYFGGLGDFQNQRSSRNTSPGLTEFITQSGRAVIWPVYKGSFERWDRFLDLGGEEFLRAIRERMVEWRWELGRTLDYLETRKDIDASRTAYFGVSFGASTPLPLLALENRIKAAILVTGGLPYRRYPREADAINYVSRIKTPILMLNGRYDYVFPLETLQKPLFDLLGTPAANKRHVIFEAAHTASLPRGQMIKETLDWLERYAK
ncbi:MAG: SUMF1/EgtB/PvdO family nonheme iron enzyme [Acidobacteria bacterium]|nr:SUMF1/EgtB/PvdO family nonheme iron enzyme [Acidobacteriota bacterium]